MKLTAEEEKLKKLVVEQLRKVKADSRVNDVTSLISEMRNSAHQLHMLLKKREVPPRHHKYMLENRGVSPESEEFYNHIHPVEDLLAFLNDSHANDDPADRTIGSDFTFSVFSRRWQHDDSYNFKRTEDGWDINHAGIGGPCDKSGHPFLFENLRQDYIDYPVDLDGRLEWLWDQAAELGLSKEQVQARLQELADWVSETEKSAPANDVWQGYK